MAARKTIDMVSETFRHTHTSNGREQEIEKVKKKTRK